MIRRYYYLTPIQQTSFVLFIWSILSLPELLEYPLWCSILRGSPGQWTIFYNQHLPIPQPTSGWSSQWKPYTNICFSYSFWTVSLCGCQCGEEKLCFINYLSRRPQFICTRETREYRWRLWAHYRLICTLLWKWREAFLFETSDSIDSIN